MTQFPRTEGSSGWQEGSGALVERFQYTDGPLTAVERFAYTTSSDYIRTAIVEDAFGGVWKTIRDAGPSSGNSRPYAGSTTLRDPVNRITRTTDDIACGTDEFCST